VSYKLCKSEFDEDISMMELAYAITAHKSQGSQSRTVILIYRSARPSCPAKCFTRRQRGSSNALSFCTTAIFPTSLRSAAIGTPKS
jgi:hypothetical protein